MNSFATKVTHATVKTSRQVAVQAAKRIAQENLETLRAAQKQVLQSPEQSTKPQTSEITSDGVPSEIAAHHAMETKIQADTNRTLSQLESELRMIRLRKQQQEQYTKQQELMPAQPTKKDAPVAQGKLRKMFGGAKAKLKQIAGKRETQKNVSG